MNSYRLFMFQILAVISVFPQLVAAAELTIIVIGNDEPVTKADIFLKNTTSHAIVNSDFTDRFGVYRYSVAPGLYEILVSKDGFSDLKISALRVMNADVEQLVELLPEVFSSEDPDKKFDFGACDPVLPGR